MSEENKRISRAVVEEAFNRGNVDALDELVDPNHKNNDPVAAELPPGVEGLKQLVRLYRSAFPDVQVTIEDEIAEGDRVVTRWSARGTHQGDFIGVQPTGKQATATGITIDRISGGKIVESWTSWDTLGVLQQLGAVPAPTGAQA